MEAFKAPSSMLGTPNKRISLPRRESKSFLPKGTARWVSLFWMIGLPAFLLLTLINLGLSIIALDEHRRAPIEGAIVTEPLHFGTRVGYPAESSWQRPLLPPSIWSTRKLTEPVDISPYLSTNETERAKYLCGKFIYSTLQRAIRAGEMAEEVFVGK